MRKRPTPPEPKPLSAKMMLIFVIPVIIIGVMFAFLNKLSSQKSRSRGAHTATPTADTNSKGTNNTMDSKSDEIIPLDANAGVPMPAIVPRPVKMRLLQGEFRISSKTKLAHKGDGLERVTDFLTEILRPFGQQDSISVVAAPHDSILLDATLNDPQLGDEGYTLFATANRIIISGNTPLGVFYGVQTLRQMLPATMFASTRPELSEIIIQCIAIKDSPRFGWRGMHLDVGRHFMPKDFIKKYIDLISMHKMNRFHWHLTEDQGWRIEIKQYPKLTEVGSIRSGTQVGHDRSKIDNTPHGGFYTQEDIKEIVAFAESRYVTVIPEIEFPGHSLAAIVAYPELGCTDKKLEVRKIWGVSHDICNPSEQTLEFFKNVFAEVAGLFPGPYFHIGGDEAPLGQWENLPVAKRRIKELGLTDIHELQSYLLNELNKHLASLGKRSVGWCDILHPDLSTSTVIMPYHGNGAANTQRAIEAGHEVVMTPTQPTYMDYIPAPDGHPAIGGGNPIKSVYDFEPVLPFVPKDKEHLIIGSQCHVWTEFMPSSEIVEKRAYPRACAMAELLWLPRDEKNFDDFSMRLGAHALRLKAYGLDIDYQVPAAHWRPAQVRTNFTQVDFDITKFIIGPGHYEINFNYTTGTHALDIEKCLLVADGEVIAEDVHAGFAGHKKRDTTYRFSVNVTGAEKYILRASIKGSGGTDSAGEINVRHIR